MARTTPGPLSKAATAEIGLALNAIDNDGPAEIPYASAPTPAVRGELEARTGELQGYLHPCRPDEIIGPLLKLFVALAHRSDSADEARVRLTIYSEALADCAPFAVTRACDDYIMGHRGDKKWCPTTAELRAAAQAIMTPWRAERDRIGKVLAARVVYPEEAEGRRRSELRDRALEHVAETRRLLQDQSRFGAIKTGDLRTLPPRLLTRDEALMVVDAIDPTRPLPKIGPVLAAALREKGYLPPEREWATEEPPRDHQDANDAL